MSINIKFRREVWFLVLSFANICFDLMWRNPYYYWRTMNHSEDGFYHNWKDYLFKYDRLDSKPNAAWWSYRELTILGFSFFVEWKRS